MSVMLIASTVILISSCNHTKNEEEIAEVNLKLQEADKQKDYQHLLMLADSLGKTGDLQEGESYYWQAYAYYRMKHRRAAEFFWKEAMNATENATDANSLTIYAKSASYLAGLYIRYINFTSAHRVVKPALEKLDKAGFDESSDYTNLLIFAGCCKGYFNPEDSVCRQLFDRAYERHLQHISNDPSPETYRNAVVGFINIAYGWLSVKKYQFGLTWTERLGRLVKDYKKRYPQDEAYIDKQWARYIIFSAIALEALGQMDKADEAFTEYQQTRFSKTFEGQMDASDYLLMAGHWEEAAENLSNLDELFASEQAGQSLEDIQTKLLKKYHANYKAGFTESANVVANQICQRLDSAIIRSQWVDSEEQETIRLKEEQILEQQERISKGRMMALITTIILLSIFFVVYTIIRHRAQNRLAAAYTQLEKKNEQLVVANACAEESARMKTNFIQQISHEIRTPLNILSGFTQIVTTPGMELDDETKTDINHQITENTDRITELVNKMLELSDASSISVIECTDQIPVMQIASEAIDAAGIGEAPHLIFELQADPAVENLILHTNQTAATRALTLLLDNAQKFTHAPEAKGSQILTDEKAHALLKISVEQGNILFTVEDTGIGVPTEEAEHIFEEFVQLDEYYNGTGIGLTVARSLVRRIGGDIKIDTSYKAGARFVMQLPMD